MKGWLNKFYGFPPKVCFHTGFSTCHRRRLACQSETTATNNVKVLSLVIVILSLSDSSLISLNNAVSLFDLSLCPFGFSTCLKEINFIVDGDGISRHRPGRYRPE